MSTLRRMKQSAIAAGVVALLALSPTAVAATVPSGTYRTNIRSGDVKGTWTFVFTKSGSYTVRGDFPGLIHGKGKYSGTTMTFDHERNGTRETCGEAAGRYRFTITGRKLTFAKISDSCEARRNVLSHTLTRVHS